MTAGTPIERAVATYHSGWQKAKASQSGVAKVNPEILGKSTPPDYVFRYIDIGSVSRGVIDWETVQPMRFADSPSRARRVVRPGDTLISTVRPMLMSHAFSDWGNQDAYVCSTGFAVIRSEGGINPQFLKHLPFAEQVTRQLVAWQCGTNYPAVNERDIYSLILPVPPPEEQIAIARVLDAVDTAIERTREAIEHAKDVKKAIIQRIFRKGLRGELQHKTEIGLIPMSWNVVPVNSVVTEFQYGLSEAMDSKGEYPILRMGNIQEGEVLLEDLKYIDLPEKIAKLYLVRRGDVLFNRTNSQEHVGKVGIYRSDEPAVFASYLIRLFPDGSQVDNYYLGQLLGSYDAQCRIKRYATPGVEQVNVNAKNLGRVLIPLPPGEEGLQEQSEIAVILEKADESIRNYRPVLDALDQLKRALMHDLLTGKVRVTNAMFSTLSSEGS